MRQQPANMLNIDQNNTKLDSGLWKRDMSDDIQGCTFQFPTGNITVPSLTCLLLDGFVMVLVNL